MKFSPPRPPRPTTGALCLPVPRPPMKRKAIDDESPEDEAFSPGTSSDDFYDYYDDDDSDSDSNKYTCRPKSFSQDNGNMASPSPASAPSPPSRPTRQAAKKASATIASYQQTLPNDVMDTSDLLSEALAPMKSEEKDDHKAWVEMESDPVSSETVHNPLTRVYTDHPPTGLLQWCAQGPGREGCQNPGVVHREH